MPPTTSILWVGLAAFTCAALTACGDGSNEQQKAGDTNAKGSQMQKPLTYKDPESGVLYYVESDRWHVSAIDKNGKILWHRDPIAESGRMSVGITPIIIHITRPHNWMLNVMKKRGKDGRYVAIGFNTKEFGLLSETDGTFTSMGSD